MKLYTVAILGATGAVGQEMMKILEERNFPVSRLIPLASARSVGKKLNFKGQELTDRKEVWELEAWYIGQAVTSYIMLLSPQRVILGGGVMHQPGLLEMVRGEVKQQINGYIRGKGMDDLDNYIVGVSLNDNQGAMGAIRLAMEALREETK